MSIDDIRNITGNAAGITQADRAEKITAVAAPFYTIDVPKETETSAETAANGILVNQWILIGALAGVMLLLLIVILVIRRRKRRGRFSLEEDEDSQRNMQLYSVSSDDDETEFFLRKKTEAEIRESVKEIAEQDPRDIGTVLETWLNRGGNDD